MEKTIVSAYYCDNYDRNKVFNVAEKILKSFGNISDIIKPNYKILLKLNLLSAYDPQQAITTHPEIVRAIIRIVKQVGAIPVVGDSPGNLTNGIDTVWEKTGMFRLAKEENIELVNFETIGCSTVSICHPTIKQVYVSKAITDCDYIINIPKLKTHTFMGFTCGIKNFYGIIPGIKKVDYHKLAPTIDDFACLLAQLYKIVKEKLLFTVVDGVCGLEGNGPSLRGIKRSYNIIAGSKDTVALDTFLLNQFGVNTEKNKFLKPLKEQNLGNTDLQNIIYIGDAVSKFNIKKAKLPVTKILSMLPLWLARFVGKYGGKLFWIKPFVVKEKCIGCLQCMKSCPAQAIIKPNNSSKPFIQKNKCIGCFCCHELCLHKAVDIKKSLIASFFIKNEKE